MHTVMDTACLQSDPPQNGHQMDAVARMKPPAPADSASLGTTCVMGSRTALMVLMKSLVVSSYCRVCISVLLFLVCS